MASVQTQLPPLTYSDWPQTVMADCVDSGVEITIYPDPMLIDGKTADEWEAHWRAERENAGRNAFWAMVAVAALAFAAMVLGWI